MSETFLRLFFMIFAPLLFWHFVAQAFGVSIPITFKDVVIVTLFVFAFVVIYAFFSSSK